MSESNFQYESIEGLEDTANKNKKRNTAIIILCIIIILLLCLLGYKVGKLGYTSTPASGGVTEQLDVITVTDEDGTEFTLKDADLNIFNNTAFDGEKIIAPHSIGTYQFYIKNEIDSNIKYNIRFLDEMSHFVNMKYKLKINNVYVCGNSSTYVDINELNIDDVILMKDSSMLCTLEWCWEDDELDTIVGTQSNYEDEYYTLRINLQASKFEK